MAKRPALSKKEDIQAVPITEPVDIETADIPPQPEPDKDTKVEVAPVVVVAAPEPVEDEQIVALKKQLDDLKKVGSNRTTELQRLQSETAENARRAQAAEQERDRAKEGTEQAQYDAILNAIGAATAEGESAERDALAASVANDPVKLIEAQRRISRVESRLERLEDGKTAFEARREAAKTEPRPVQVDPFEQQIGAVPDPAKVWLRGHRDYVTDTRKNAKIQSLHWDVLDEGHTAFSPSYFESLETHLGLRQPPKVEDDDAPQPAPQRQETVVSAPVSRSDSPTLSGAKPSSTRVTLTPEEREAAKLSGVDERVYAQNKLKLQELKKQGHYN
jgi:hypothetical protein